MIRTAARNTMFLAAATLAMGALAVNCSRNKEPAHNSELGSVGLAITLPSGATISSVHYVIRNSAMVQVSAGDIPSTAPGSTVSVVVGGIAAGAGYTVSLDATASDGSTCMGTSMAFAVIANMSTSVNVLLLCRTTGGTGTVGVDGTIDNCPVVTSYTAAPLAVAVGGTISVGAVGSDSDPTDTVSYLWTAPGGSFAAPTSASTTYTCPATGSSQQTLTITVSDTKCTTPATITVTCGSCGNGAIDSGEACDPAASPTGAPANFVCNNSCQAVPVCGNGVMQAGEQCDPPLAGFCSPTCQNVSPVCGDGTVQPAASEQCDPPGPIAGSANTCSTSCQIVIPAGTGGAGVGGSVGGSTGSGTGGATGTGGVTASGGTGVGGSVGGSTGAGGSVGGSTGSGPTAACRACEAVECTPQGYGCHLLTGSAQTACSAVEACIRTTHCDPLGDTSFCYCGTANQDDGSCLAAPLGPCVAVMEAADTNILPTDTALQRANKIFGDLVDASLPLGKATNLMGCDAFSCNAANQCGGQF